MAPLMVINTALLLVVVRESDDAANRTDIDHIKAELKSRNRTVFAVINMWSLRFHQSVTVIYKQFDHKEMNLCQFFSEKMIFCARLFKDGTGLGVMSNCTITVRRWMATMRPPSP